MYACISYLIMFHKLKHSHKNKNEICLKKKGNMKDWNEKHIYFVYTFTYKDFSFTEEKGNENTTQRWFP